MNDWVDFGTVKAVVSLEAVLRYYHVPGLHGRRDQLKGRCPIHQGKREDSFRASLSKNVFHCFACQASGNVLDFVATMEKCSIRQAALHLQRWFGLAGPTEAAVAWLQPALGSGKVELVRKKERRNLPLRFALSGVDPSHPYLAERGVERATAVTFGVGFYAGPGLMSRRIVIPIRNISGEIVAYAGRVLDGGLPKYKLPTGFRKGLELFNLHRAVATGSRAVIVVEGYFDSLRVHQAGFPSVVALMGSSLSQEQERTLIGHFEQVFLMLDGDTAGRTASRAITGQLSPSCCAMTIHVPCGRQPDQMSATDIQRLLLGIVTPSRFPQTL
jgi:DNA primase